jgi:hypothetical protein
VALADLATQAGDRMTGREHVIFIRERVAWCDGCWWIVTGDSDDVEDSAQYHAFTARGRIRPGWGVRRPTRRRRSAA